MSSLDMLLAACASIAHAVPTMDTLRGSFTTRAQTISACCLLSGDSEERARKLHYSHEHWLEALHAGTDELAEAVTIFADILPRKAPQKLRDLTVTVVPALQQRVASKMWSEGFRQTALTLLVAEVRIDGGWEKLLGSTDSKVQGSRLCALLEHLEEEDRAPGGEASLHVCSFCKLFNLKYV